MKLKHNIPLGTHVAFKGEYGVYIVTDYTTLLACEQPCNIPHESGCFEEPYICVREEIRTSFPLSRLETIFGKDSIGRKPTPAELTPQKVQT